MLNSPAGPPGAARMHERQAAALAAVTEQIALFMTVHVP
jgi:hypothetical protein